MHTLSLKLTVSRPPFGEHLRPEHDVGLHAAHKRWQILGKALPILHVCCHMGVVAGASGWEVVEEHVRVSRLCFGMGCCRAIHANATGLLVCLGMSWTLSIETEVVKKVVWVGVCGGVCEWVGV
jgi:hypothetical protein